MALAHEPNPPNETIVTLFQGIHTAACIQQIRVAGRDSRASINVTNRLQWHLWFNIFTEN